MKKIITVLAAVVLLCATVFSMTSCFGKVDMAELKTALEEVAKKDNNITVSCNDKTEDKAMIKSYSVYIKDGDDRISLYIIEFGSKKLAKLYVEQLKMQLEFEEEGNKLQKKINEELVELGAETDEIEESDEAVIKRRGAVVIFGDKAAYDKLNDIDTVKSLI